MRPGQKLGYAGRASSASPAAGYKKLHELQLKEFINAALSDGDLSDMVE
jgi:2-oxoglutarate dehydrogenase E1 component